MILFSLLMCFLFFPSEGLAHGATISARVEGNVVRSESKLSTGKALQHGKITVMDGSGNTLLTGETDHHGIFSFSLPKQKPITIIVNSGDGHRAEWTLGEDDLPQQLEQTRIKDILGGIGYIVGLMGLGAYLHYRKKLKNLSNS
ncbi:MAG: hypothetical protein HQM14_10420 [SAR324 cluster bacterium]|nr:hypothetical protein [SAR324 cluster bacterium]